MGEKNTNEHFINPSVATPFSPGGSIAQYVAFLNSIGTPATLSEDGRACWLSRQRGQLQRFPTECTTPPAEEEISDLLRRRGVWLVNYLLDEGPACPANCYDYLCSASDYQIANLDKHGRRDTRRGLRRFTVRLCRWEELIEHGYPASEDTAARHGYRPPSKASLDRYARTHGASPFCDIWGAWRDDQLAAYMTVIKVDDFAEIDVARSRTDTLNDCPNNALSFAATQHLLHEEGRSYVSYGLSTLQVQANEFAMHKYKKRMGYEPVPRHRAFAMRPLLRPLLKTKAGSWALERVAGMFPRRAGLRKAAGLSRLLSGRETAPLAWAEQD